MNPCISYSTHVMNNVCICMLYFLPFVFLVYLLIWTFTDMLLWQHYSTCREEQALHIFYNCLLLKILCIFVLERWFQSDLLTYFHSVIAVYFNQFPLGTLLICKHTNICMYIYICLYICVIAYKYRVEEPS